MGNVNRWVQVFNEKLSKPMAANRFLGKIDKSIWIFLKEDAPGITVPKQNANQEINVNRVNSKNPVWKQSIGEERVL